MEGAGAGRPREVRREGRGQGQGRCRDLPRIRRHSRLQTWAGQQAPASSGLAAAAKLGERRKGGEQERSNCCGQQESLFRPARTRVTAGALFLLFCVLEVAVFNPQARGKNSGERTVNYFICQKDLDVFTVISGKKKTTNNSEERSVERFGVQFEQVQSGTFLELLLSMGFHLQHRSSAP